LTNTCALIEVYVYLCIINSKQIHNAMTYSINIINLEQCHLIQQDSEGKEIIQDIALKTFFEKAQELGFLPEAQDFDDEACVIVFDFYGIEKSVQRTYASMMDNDCFGTEDLQEIIASFFETFPEKLYWIKANNVEVLHRTPRRECDGKNWRLYATTAGETRHIETGFIDTEWSEFQTSQKVAIEILIKQLEGHIKVLNHRLECLK